MAYFAFAGGLFRPVPEIDCAVLNDGRRVLSQRSVNRALGRKHGGAEFRKRTEAGGELPVFLIGKALQPFISDELRAVVNRPILYDAAPGAALAHGIDASALPMVCEVWVRAHQAGALRPNQIPAAIRAKILKDGLAQVGITALVDEATGYQSQRPKDELRLILEAYISKELLPWTERFPEDFYAVDDDGHNATLRFTPADGGGEFKVAWAELHHAGRWRRVESC